MIGAAHGVLGAAAAFGALPSVRLDVPVDPDAEEARRWIIEELTKPRYEAAKPTWFDRASTAFWEWLNSFTIDAEGGPSGLMLLIVIVLIVAALVAAFLIFGLPALNRRSTVVGSLFGHDDERSAAEMRRAADAAAARADWAVAIEESFRAIARGLAERTILTTSPGTTAHGFADRAGTLFPSAAQGLWRAAASFDQVRYLGADGSEATYRELVELERELRNARVPASVPGSVPGSGSGSGSGSATVNG